MHLNPTSVWRMLCLTLTAHAGTYGARTYKEEKILDFFAFLLGSQKIIPEISLSRVLCATQGLGASRLDLTKYYMNVLKLTRLDST